MRVKLRVRQIVEVRILKEFRVRGRKEDKKMLNNIWGSECKIDYYGKELDWQVKVIKGFL